MEGPPRQTPITPSSPRRCVNFAPYRHISWQVFGLAGCLLVPASQSISGPVLSTRRSFLLTAAGQLRILTGFPIKPNFAIGYREVKRLYQALTCQSTAIYRGICVNQADFFFERERRGEGHQIATVLGFAMNEGAMPLPSFAQFVSCKKMRRTRESVPLVVEI